MNTYEIDLLRQMWKLERITEEQVVGQLILHAQKVAQMVPEHEDRLKVLRWGVVGVEQGVGLLKRKAE